MLTKSNTGIFNDARQSSGAEISHSRRVAVWSVELAKTLDTTTAEQNAMELAALAHHLPPGCDPAMRNKFLLALGIDKGSIAATADQVHEILRALHDQTVLNPGSTKLAAVIELANALDERLEWESLGTESDEPEPAVELALERLQAVAAREIEGAVHATPPLAPIAERGFSLLFRPGATVTDLEAMLAMEPAVVTNIDTRALENMGLQTALRIVCAASIRSLFMDAALHRVWNHGLRVAQLAEGLARLSGQADPAEAFVAGLLHDVGRLPMALLPIEFRRRFAHAHNKGCEPDLIERVFCASTHAQAGASVLRKWKLPEAVTRAVEHHHEPERGDARLADLLCVADDPLGKHEDLPSVVRRRAALNRLKLHGETLAHIGTFDKSPLDTLKFAA